MNRGTGLVVLLVIGVAAALALPTSGHGPTRLGIRAIADGVVPPVEGVLFTAAYDVPNLPPRLTLRNDAPRDLDVLDAAGQVLFRIGASGVLGNVRSKAYRPALDPFGKLPAPTPPPGTDPEWRALSAEPALRWYEARIDFHGIVPARVSTQVDLSKWRLPARYDGREVELTGRIMFKPVTGRIEARLGPVSFARPDLEVHLIQGPVPALTVTNETEAGLEITGRDGRPFARVGPGGVEVNLESATWADTFAMPEAAGGPPRWQKSQDRPVLVWLERRAAYELAEPPAEVLRPEGETVLVRWSIPGMLGEMPVTIVGETVWVPRAAATSDGSSVVPAVAGAAGGSAILVLGAGFWWRRRRAHGSRSG